MFLLKVQIHVLQTPQQVHHKHLRLLQTHQTNPFVTRADEFVAELTDL